MVWFSEHFLSSHCLLVTQPVVILLLGGSLWWEDTQALGNTQVHVRAIQRLPCCV